MEEETRPSVYASTREHKIRVGRGFSLEELKQAGLTLHQAKRFEILVDKRRRTAHKENVEVLKENFGVSIPLNEIKGIGKVAEEELKKAGILDAYDLASADTSALAGKVSRSEKTLKRWQSEAKKLLGK
jgi:large subunit ribosomal protein L13e